MFRRLRLRRPSHSTVVAYLALFLALGGTGAYAANTVFSTDIVDGEVKAPDIAANAVDSARVRDNTLNTFDVHSFLGVDVVDNTLTGADVDESTLNLAAGPWHEVGAVGEPGFFQGMFCVYSNFDQPGDNFHNSAGFVRDRFGFVHLKGLVDADDAPGGTCGVGGLEDVIFTLPVGHRPARREVLATITNGVFGRINIDSDGLVKYDTSVANAKEWISLDGISFRCAPSGQGGCP